MKKLICVILVVFACLTASAKNGATSYNHFGLLFAGDTKEHYGFALTGNVGYFSLGCDAKFSQRKETLLDLNLGIALADYVYLMGVVGYDIVPDTPAAYEQIDYGGKLVLRIPVVPLAVSAGWTKFGQVTFGIGIFF